MMFSDKQKFYIKPKAVDRHDVEQRPKPFHVKGLKTALSVGKFQSGHFTDNEIHDLTALFPSPRLMSADQRAIESARAKGDIVLPATDRVDNFWHFLDRGG